MPKAAEDLTGKIFTKLKVLKRVENDANGRARWLCECQCENKTLLVVPAKNLRNGNTKSCGCLKREKLAQRNEKHGYSKIPAYQLWRQHKRMNCLCKEWENVDAFFKFLENVGYDMKSHITIWRSDASKPFSPNNFNFKYVEKREVGGVENLGEGLTGRTFGNLIVLGYAGSKQRPDGNKYRTWLCECQCENKTQVITTTDKLLSGKKIDCGCGYRKRLLNNEYKRTDVKAALDGFDPYNNLDSKERVKVYERLYSIYRMMHDRCENPKSPGYHKYGALGVYVCDEWSDKTLGFVNFLKWALSNGYDHGLTLDRRDSSNCYCPENCRWKNYHDQGSHTIRNVYVYDGSLWYTVADFERRYNLPQSYVSSRRAYGWDIHAIVYSVVFSQAIIKVKNEYYDKDGTKVLIPILKENLYDDETKYRLYSEQMDGNLTISKQSARPKTYQEYLLYLKGRGKF